MIFIRYFILLLAIFGISPPTHADNIPLISERPIHEAYATRHADVTPTLVVPKEPPEDLIHNIPPKPNELAVWVPGYWAWIAEKQSYSWICGVWRIPPPDHEWIDGSWIKHESGWIYINGFWSLFPKQKLTLIKKTPPNPITDNPTTPPDSNSFWASGYWQYSADTGKFGWLIGAWQQYDPNWVLVSAHYVWRPDGYIFIPPYWDFPINKRGVLYNCTLPPTTISSDEVIQICFANYPNHIDWINHWWHFNPNWWNNCECVPPWWHWNTWWTFSWQDHWNLWWWFSHPGFPQPLWINLELSKKITPPTGNIIELMKHFNEPVFLKQMQPIKDALQPIGKSIEKNVERPVIKNDVRPIGKVILPKIIPSLIKLPPKPTPQYTPQPFIHETIERDEPSLTPSLDTDRPDYSQYEPMYEYRYQPEYKYQPDYYYKPYRETDEFEHRNRDSHDKRSHGSYDKGDSGSYERGNHSSYDKSDYRDRRDTEGSNNRESGSKRGSKGR